MKARGTIVCAGVLAIGAMAGLPPASALAQGKALTPVAGDAAHDREVFEKLNTLEGEWQLVQEDGSLGLGSTFQVSSNGSIVREVMFPGTENEMTNIYHMDGTDVVATHYCAIGNQPRMVARNLELTKEGVSLDFKLQRVSNFRDGQTHYMGGLRLTFVDEDTIHQDWTSFDPEGNVAGTMTFIMKRKH